MLIALGLLLFVLLIIVHEYGHFIAARKNGVEVEEFGLGFPPQARVIGKKNGTDYTLNWLPLGGFVRLKGENDSATGKGTFGAAKFSKKALIIAAGVMMNFAAAAVIFTILAAIGMPRLIDNQFQVSSDALVTRQEVFAAVVESGSPAEKAGIQTNDRITKIDDVDLTSAAQLRETTASKGGKTISVTVKSSGTESVKKVTLRDDPTKGNLGVAPAEQTLVRSTWSAPIVGIGTTVQSTVETFKGLGIAVANLFSGHGAKASESVTGPVGIVVVLKDLSKQGFVFVLFLIGVISVSLAVMNILPIPALDGGRLFVMALFRVLHKPLSKELEEKIHGTGMAVLLLFALLITIVDVRRFF